MLSVVKKLQALKDPSICTIFAKQLLYLIEDKMLRCAPDDREKIDIICTDLSKILESLPKETNPEELSRDLAFIGREEPAPFVPAPGDISLYEEPRDLVTESPSTPTGDGGGSAAATPTRPPRSRRENSTRSEGRKNHASNTNAQGGLKTPAANGVAATAPKETNNQPSKTTFRLKLTKALYRDVAGSDIQSQPPSTTKKNKTKYQISQRFKKWFKEPWNNYSNI